VLPVSSRRRELCCINLIAYHSAILLCIAHTLPFISLSALSNLASFIFHTYQSHATSASILPLLIGHVKHLTSFSPSYYRLVSLRLNLHLISVIFPIQSPHYPSNIINLHLIWQGNVAVEDDGTALINGAQTGALIAGAAVGLVFLGPLAPVAVLGGAGVYAM
jgi:hypothetical protein